MIMGVADDAMKTVEGAIQSGEEKKQIVIATVKASCKSAGVDLDAFIDQLSTYIDQTISFVNSMKK
jgi:hypothetical protein